MTPSEAKDLLDAAKAEGLDDISIENLQCGRVTRSVMRLMRARLAKVESSNPMADAFMGDIFTAEWLNDLLQAGRVMWESRKVEMCEQAMKEVK